MPQKRNPDAAELVRGHCGRIIGCLTALMMTMKGLPLAYSKDMQDDKPPVFEAHDLLALSIAAMTGMIETLTFRTERMRAAAEAGFSTATDLADWLVRVAGVPFREAHHITGAVVKLAEGKGVALVRSAARRTAGDRSAHRLGRAGCAIGRRLGRGADQRGRHRAGPRARGDRRGAQGFGGGMMRTTAIVACLGARAARRLRQEERAQARAGTCRCRSSRRPRRRSPASTDLLTAGPQAGRCATTSW